MQNLIRETYFLLLLGTLMAKPVLKPTEVGAAGLTDPQVIFARAAV